MRHTEGRRDGSQTLPRAVPHAPVFDRLMLQRRRIAALKAAPTSVFAIRGTLKFNQGVVHQVLLEDTVDDLDPFDQTGFGEVLPRHGLCSRRESIPNPQIAILVGRRPHRTTWVSLHRSLSTRGSPTIDNVNRLVADQGFPWVDTGPLEQHSHRPEKWENV
jgi:hypothetical protein